MLRSWLFAPCHSTLTGPARAWPQLEVEFPTLARLEAFWAAIPPEEHKAWSQRLQVLLYESPAT